VTHMHAISRSPKYFRFPLLENHFKLPART
jgi:hypothetical protein